MSLPSSSARVTARSVNSSPRALASRRARIRNQATDGGSARHSSSSARAFTCRGGASPRTRRRGPPRAPAAQARPPPPRALPRRRSRRERSAPAHPPTSALDRGERALEPFLELHLRLPAELLACACGVERDVLDLA